jgi:hypothetical protein
MTSEDVGLCGAFSLPPTCLRRPPIPRRPSNASPPTMIRRRRLSTMFSARAAPSTCTVPPRTYAMPTASRLARSPDARPAIRRPDVRRPCLTPVPAHFAHHASEADRRTPHSPNAYTKSTTEWRDICRPRMHECCVGPVFGCQPCIRPRLARLHRQTGRFKLALRQLACWLCALTGSQSSSGLNSGCPCS